MRTLISIIVCSSAATIATGITAKTIRILPVVPSSERDSLAFLTEKLRGGASSDSSKKTRKKKKKKGGASKGKAKKAIDDAMKEKDTAEALGDAIR